MTWNRCANDLYDHWAELSGDDGWSWANIEKYYLKVTFPPPRISITTQANLLPYRLHVW